MSIIIGRKQEQKELRRLFESDESEMVVVYGRRRVGKTYLVNRTFGEENFTFKVTGLHRRRMAAQLENFDIAMKEYAVGFPIPKSKSWMEAFGTLKQYLKKTKNKEKRILFFDELPWMDTKGSSFLSALEWFWNGWANAQDDIMLIICGSSTNWIINKLLKQKGGLYNRASSKIFLNPFTLSETEEYLKAKGFEFERYDIAQIYMIFGGIPYYLKQLEREKTLSENVDDCLFKKNGKLWDEFENLYETLFEDSNLYIKIAETLANRQTGLTRNEILKLAKLPDNGMVSKALENLEKCGLINSYNFFGRKNKTRTYLLTDFYTLFYFRFIKDANDEHYWTHMTDNPRKNQWSGYSFEQLVNYHISQVKETLGIGSVLTEQSSWRIEGCELDDDKLHGAQIDLIIDRRDRAINICEIKFYGGEFVIQKEYSMNLRNKVEAFRSATKTKKTLVPTMITTFGVKQNMYSNYIGQQVTLNDLFR